MTCLISDITKRVALIVLSAVNSANSASKNTTGLHSTLKIVNSFSLRDN